MRWPVNIAHGGRAMIVAAATTVSGAAGGSDAIAIALITAAGGVAAVVVGPFVTDWVRRRHRVQVDHHDELAKEQVALAEHFVGEIVALKAENDRLRAELNRKGRRRA